MVVALVGDRDVGGKEGGLLNVELWWVNDGLR